jgi:hypothetical protein
MRGKPRVGATKLQRQKRREPVETFSRPAMASRRSAASLLDVLKTISMESHKLV